MNSLNGWWTCSPLEEVKKKPLSKANWRDPKWVYIPASHTNISATFARVRKELAEGRKV